MTRHATCPRCLHTFPVADRDDAARPLTCPACGTAFSPTGEQSKGSDTHGGIQKGSPGDVAAHRQAPNRAIGESVEDEGRRRIDALAQRIAHHGAAKPVSRATVLFALPALVLPWAGLAAAAAIAKYRDLGAEVISDIVFAFSVLVLALSCVVMVTSLIGGLDAAYRERSPAAFGRTFLSVFFSAHCVISVLVLVALAVVTFIVAVCAIAKP